MAEDTFLVSKVMAPIPNDEKKPEAPPSALALAGKVLFPLLLMLIFKTFDTATETVSIVLAAIAFKALLDRLFNHVKTKAVQYITQRQVQKMQAEMLNQMKQMNKEQGKSRRKREWVVDE
jgi:Skp family chaperone for outer membrane proteins